MSEYYLNETVVTFPGNIIQDSTINMLRLSDPDAALIISRGQMQEGDELASQIEQQNEKTGETGKGSSLHASSGNTGRD